MGRCPGRAWAYAAASLLAIDTLLQPAHAIGQEEEIIVDPELAGESAGSSASAPNGDEVIEDPELGIGAPANEPEPDYGWGSVYRPKEQEQANASETLPPEEEEFDPLANTGIAKLEVIGQGAVDLHHEGSLEDFYEARLRAGGEIDFRLSRKLRLSIGTRIDFAWYAPYQNDPSLTRLVTAGEDAMHNPLYRQVHQSALSQARYEVDIVPLSAYVDSTLADGVHLRIGEQVISLARMDGFSATDILAVYDLRPQARATPAGLKLAQPAVRLDWDFNSWSTLQLVYVPWFMPHLSRPNRDRYVGGALTGYGPQPGADPALAVLNGQIQHSIDQLIAPSYQTVAQQDALRFVGPAPNFKNPQAEARLNFRGSRFEMALLGGTALEKLPAVYYTPALGDVLLNTDTASAAFTELAKALQRGESVLDVEYHRYYVAGFDGSFDVAPLQFSFEFAYSPSRHLYAMKNDGSQLPLPDVSAPIVDPDIANGKPSNVTDRSIRKGTPMVQAALHMEYLKGETFLLMAETFMLQALQLPHDLSRSWLGFQKAKGTYIGGLIAASYNLDEGRYRFDASMLALMGPSFIVTPQIEVRVVDGFYLNLGAQIFEGPTPNNVGKTGIAATNLTPGGVFSGYDNAYLGFRWIPD